jgi:Trypsin-like serine proteases, typically periplasmic, contain C-terminal PDZ domain
VALYERVSPGVVSLLVTSDLGYAQGSGFVIDTEGHVVTNYHVVEGATKVEVDFPSGFKAYGNVVGTDLDSDLAVVKVDAAADHFTPIPLGDSDQLKVGQTVVAIGNPFGLSGTMTVGIISARGRTLSSMRQTPEGAYYTAGDLLQTDAAINPGNSGGPLINLNGEVVGVNRAIQTSSSTLGGTPVNSGVGFAVSVNIVRRVVPLLIQQGKVDYPYLGITSLPDISLTEQEALGLTQTNGGYITSVVTGGPADAAGLRGGTRPTSIEGLQAGGDLIIGVDNQQVVVFGDLLRYLMLNKSPGDTIKLIILRDNQQKEVNLTLGKRP